MKNVIGVGSLVILAGLAGCIHTKNEVEIKPVEIKPIQISLDVRVQVDEALNKSAKNGDVLNDALITRLRERKPQLAVWKEMGAVGESNRASVVNRLPEDDRSWKAVQILIDAENRDRAELIKEIAQSRNLSVEAVEMGWAVRISEKAEAGTWLEDADATWYQK